MKSSPCRLNSSTCRSLRLGVLCFSAQIYFDFSGYSDMAIGLSQIFGFRLKENFRQPYTAINFTDFWRRWQISRSTWIRGRSLYIPLGGNRVSLARTYFNLCLCFFLSGLWHGAAWTFIIWGLFHGTMLIADRVFWKQWQTHLPKIINVAITFFLVMISWVIFRSQSLDQIGFYLRAMFIPRAVEPTLLSVSADIVWDLPQLRTSSFSYLSCLDSRKFLRGTRILLCVEPASLSGPTACFYSPSPEFLHFPTSRSSTSAFDKL